MKRSIPLLLLLAACAGGRAGRGGEPLRIQASHYESMTGVTLTTDGDETTRCRREMITGSHIPRWYCTFRDDSAQYLLDRHIVFAAR
jgi:hypothetical protein